MFGKKKQPPLTPPPGLGKEDIAIEKSICTGEGVIGFRDPKTKKAFAGGSRPNPKRNRRVLPLLWV